MRASSITSAVPEPLSLAASPKPMPSIWAATMYISPGWVVPILVHQTSWRSPGTAGGVSRARMRASGCFMGSSLTPAGLMTPRWRAPPTPNSGVAAFGLMAGPRR